MLCILCEENEASVVGICYKCAGDLISEVVQSMCELDKKYEAGFDEGYNKGHEKGFDEGHAIGCESIRKEIRENSYSFDLVKEFFREATKSPFEFNRLKECMEDIGLEFSKVSSVKHNTE